MNLRIRIVRLRAVPRALALSVGCLAALFVPSAARAGDADPQVSLPGHGLHGPWAAVTFNPADFGYVEQEFVVSGTARAFGADLPSKSYATRILVYRPKDAADFSGDVDVEWDNVTGQLDAPVAFSYLAPHVMRTGDAYVEVTTQQAGLCGQNLTGDSLLTLHGISVAACTPVSVKGSDPMRYGALHHPGDQYTFDIFSQVAKAVKSPSGLRPLGDLKAERVFAVGESQSAVELDGYISNGADRAAHIFDGFLLDADFGATQPVSFRAPTVTIWSEESVQEGVPQSAPNHRIWSIAGASHFDAYGLQQIVPWVVQSLTNSARKSKAAELASRRASSNYGQEGPGAGLTCVGGDEFQRRYVFDAALEAVQNWARTGHAAPTGAPLAYSGLRRTVSALPPLPFPFLNVGNLLIGGSAPLGMTKDQYGNAAGGIRLPQVDVPVARYDGGACVLLGTTTPFSPATLRRLYPTHETYVTKMLESTRRSLRSRFLTPHDALEQMQLACESAIPSWGTTPVADRPAVCRSLKAALG